MTIEYARPCVDAAIPLRCYNRCPECRATESTTILMEESIVPPTLGAYMVRMRLKMLVMVARLSACQEHG